MDRKEGYVLDVYIHLLIYLYIYMFPGGLESWWLIVEVQIFNDTDLCQRFIRLG